MNVLVVVAHPDDELLGCGGTILKHIRAGDTVYIGILAEGITSRNADVTPLPHQELDELHATARLVSERIGAKKLFMGGFSDNRMDEHALLNIVKVVENWVNEVCPEIVYTHAAGDLNVDHAVTNRAVMTATRPQPGHHIVKELLAMEIPSSTEWAFSQLPPAFHPTLFIDISDTLCEKLSLLDLYEGEMRAAPHPRSREVVQALATVRGSAVSVPAAEAFAVLRICRQ